MTVTATALKSLPEEITAVCNDGTNLFLGTNMGNVYKYVISGGATTLLKTLNARVQSMSLYSGTLYIGLSGGGLSSLTTS